jgi:hypothetical protein
MSLRACPLRKPSHRRSSSHTVEITCKPRAPQPNGCTSCLYWPWHARPARGAHPSAARAPDAICKIQESELPAVQHCGHHATHCSTCPRSPSLINPPHPSHLDAVPALPQHAVPVHPEPQPLQPPRNNRLLRLSRAHRRPVVGRRKGVGAADQRPLFAFAALRLLHVRERRAASCRCCFHRRTGFAIRRGDRRLALRWPPDCRPQYARRRQRQPGTPLACASLLSR